MTKKKVAKALRGIAVTKAQYKWLKRNWARTPKNERLLPNK